MTRQQRKEEVDLGRTVISWLESSGYQVWQEVPVRYYPATIDIVAWRSDDTYPMLIELKRSLNEKVLMQAAQRRYLSDSVWCATFSKKPRNLPLAKRWGLGILSVSESGVAVLCEPSFGGRMPRLDLWRERLCLDAARANHAEAGSPSPAPAALCEERVLQYRAENPDATWRETYDAVPNHYASPQSMAGAMRMRALLADQQSELRDMESQDG